MIKLKGFFDVRVVLAIVLLSVVLGVLNNLRVYEEQRVNWFGGPVVAAED
ncbi:MAG: hypothetical protein IKO55_07450 [Kiritimatiellae bacterium]|nr:hypothetical protein [Kiritimatiellia bacterium]